MTRSSSSSLSFSWGFSLLELNLVVATIAIVALLVAPARAPAEDAQAGLAVVQLESALRFARDQASQTQAAYGLSLSASGQRVAVVRIDPITDTMRFDVYHPLTKALYTLDFGTDVRVQFLWAGTAGIPAATSVWQDGLANCTDTNALMFDPSGVTRCANPLGGRLQDVAVRIGSKRSNVRLEVDAFTGRVVRTKT